MTSLDKFNESLKLLNEDLPVIEINETNSNYAKLPTGESLYISSSDLSKIAKQRLAAINVIYYTSARMSWIQRLSERQFDKIKEWCYTIDANQIPLYWRRYAKPSKIIDPTISQQKVDRIREMIESESAKRSSTNENEFMDKGLPEDFDEWFESVSDRI